MMIYTFEAALSTMRSTYRTILGWSSSFSRFTSVTNCCFSRLLIFSKLISFQTRVSPPALGRTLRTTPKDPLPIYSRGTYLSIQNLKQLLGTPLNISKPNLFSSHHSRKALMRMAMQEVSVNAFNLMMLFIASLLYYPLKIFIFLVYPIGLIVKALQVQQTRSEEDQNNRKKKLLMLATLFVFYSIIEKIFSQFDSKFFLLLFMTGGAVLARENGYFDQGLQKVESLVAKIKQK